MKLKIDFRDIESYEPLPRNDYPVRVDKVFVKTKEGGEYPYFELKLKVDGGEFDDRGLTKRASTSPGALWGLAADLKALGVEDDLVEIEVDDDTDELLEPDLTGLTATARVKKTIYQGRPTNEVEYLLPRNGARPSGRTSPEAGPAKAAPANKRSFR